MQKLKTIFCLTTALLILSAGTPAIYTDTANAQTLLPSESTGSNCSKLTDSDPKNDIDVKGGDCLVEKIQTGKIHFNDIPYFIGHAIKFLLSIAGALAVIMIIAGGFQYILGGFNEDMKGKGKTTLKYAVEGLAIASLAWLMIDIFINLLTS